MPRNNIDFFTAQLLNNTLNPRPLHPHTSAYGIDVMVIGNNGDLGPVSGLAGCSHYFYDPLTDFRHLRLEQHSQKIRMAPGQDNLRPPCLPYNIQ